MEPGRTPAPGVAGARPTSVSARKAAARRGLAEKSRRWQGRVLRVRFRWLDASSPAGLDEPTAPGPDPGFSPVPPVLTLAVARKQARRAVDRNRVKRLVREWFRSPARRMRPADLLVGLHRPWVRHTSEPDLRADLDDLAGVLAGRASGPESARERPRGAARRPPPPVSGPPAA